MSRLIISSLIWAGSETAEELSQSSQKFSDLLPNQIEKEINKLCELGIISHESRILELEACVEGILRALLRSPFTIPDLNAQASREIGRSIGQEKILDVLSILYQTDIVQPYGPTRWIENLLPKSVFRNVRDQQVRVNVTDCPITSLYVGYEALCIQFWNDGILEPWEIEELTQYKQKNGLDTLRCQFILKTTRESSNFDFGETTDLQDVIKRHFDLGLTLDFIESSLVANYEVAPEVARILCYETPNRTEKNASRFTVKVDSLSVNVGYANLQNSSLPFQVSKQGLNVLVDLCNKRLETSDKSQVTEALHDAVTYAFSPASCQNHVLEFLDLKWSSSDLKDSIRLQLS